MEILKGQAIIWTIILMAGCTASEVKPFNPGSTEATLTEAGCIQWPEKRSPYPRGIILRRDQASKRTPFLKMIYSV